MPHSRAASCRARWAQKISHVLVSMPPSLLESEYPSMTSWVLFQEASSLPYPGELHSSRQMRGALRRSSMDSKSGTGIRPGSPPRPAISTPPSRASQITAVTSSTEDAPLTM